MTSPARPPSVVQRHQLASYLALTFAISWAIWVGLILGSLHIQTLLGAALNVVAIAVPSIAALVLAVVGRAPPTSAVGTRPGCLAGGSTSTLHP